MTTRVRRLTTQAVSSASSTATGVRTSCGSGAWSATVISALPGLIPVPTTAFPLT